MDHWQGMGQNAQIKAGFDRLPVGSYILSVTRACLDSPFSLGDCFIAEHAIVHSGPNPRHPPQLGNGQPSTHAPPSNGAAVCSFLQPFKHNRAMAQNAIFAYVCAVLGFGAQDKDQIDREIRPHLENLMRGITSASNPLMGCLIQCDSIPADWTKDGAQVFGTNQKYLPAPFEQLGAKRPTVHELLAKIGTGHAGLPPGATHTNPATWGGAPQGYQQNAGPPPGYGAAPPWAPQGQAPVAPVNGAPWSPPNVAAAAPPWAQPGHAGPPAGQGQDWVSPAPAAPPWAPAGNPAPGAWAPPGMAPQGPPPGPSYPPGTQFYPGPGPAGAKGFCVPGGTWTEIK